MKELHQVKCFVDQDGDIYTIRPDGTSNYPSDIEVVGDTVRILGEPDGLEGREIVDEFVLWPSLTSLALAIEAPVKEADGVSLNEAVHDAQISAMKFREDWLSNHESNPNYWPLVLPTEDAGSWFEHISSFESKE